GADRPLAPLLLPLLARALSRAEVALGARDERAAALRRAPVDPVAQAERGLDDVMDEVVRDVGVVGGRRIHRALGRASGADDDRVTTGPGALETDNHRG